MLLIYFEAWTFANKEFSLFSLKIVSVLEITPFDGAIVPVLREPK